MTIPREKALQHASLARQVDAFLARGGRVETIPYRGEPMRASVRREAHRTQQPFKKFHRHHAPPAPRPMLAY